MAVAYIGLGANLGNRLEMLQKALDALAESITVLAASSVYETAAVGCPDQPDFLNAVAKIETDLCPRELLHLLLRIEAHLCRTRQKRWGPRTIDLDVLSYDQRISREPGLILPHPRMHERAFVLVPLAEIAPRFVHPVRQENALALVAAHASTQRITKTESSLRIPAGQGHGVRPDGPCSSQPMGGETGET